MKNFYRIATGTEVGKIALKIAHHRPDLWRDDTYLRDYPQGPFGDTDTIFLRFPERSVKETEEALKAHLEFVDQHESVDYPAYTVLVEARAVVMNLMAYVGGERLGRVMINRIRPGGRIYPHVDTATHTAYYTRFHVVLQGLPGVMFRAGDEQVNMLTGDVWWFDNAVEHEVVNNSGDDRIHMVVDIRTQRPPIQISDRSPLAEDLALEEIEIWREKADMIGVSPESAVWKSMDPESPFYDPDYDGIPF
jgi:hypothetical protein